LTIFNEKNAVLAGLRRVFLRQNIVKYQSQKCKVIFSAFLRQQENIREIQKDNDLFQYWCMAWSFDYVKFERYLFLIKKGKAYFVFEENEWRIDEK